MTPQDTPASTTAYAALFAGLDFTISEWLTLLGMNCCQPSEHRYMFGQTVDLQQSRLPMEVADTCSDCGTDRSLADRVYALSPAFRIAILEAVEQFWASNNYAETFEEKLARLGIRPARDSHDRLRAQQFRERHDHTEAATV